jgi:hypothetical protein
MSTKPQIQIAFTKEQLEDFLDIVCLGQWMINGPRVERIEKYDALAQQVFKAAKDAGLKGVEYDEKDAEYWLTAEYEDSVLREFIEAYDNEIFWDDLPDRLAERDMERKFGGKAIKAMDNKQRFIAHQTICRKYEEEFEKHGVERLTVPDVSEAPQDSKG